MTETFFTKELRSIINSDNKENVIMYLRQKNILQYSLNCLTCSSIMRQVKRRGAPDGFAFRCNNLSCSKYQHHRSIRSESVLEDIKIPLNKFIHFIYLYSIETCQKNIQEIIGLSRSTIYTLLKKIRARISMYFENNNILLGGPNLLVQIDESKFNFNVKAHRGHVPTTPVWVFGIVDTSYQPARGFMKIVEQRNRETLLSIIQAHVRPGSIIHSDEWRAYSNLNELQYTHGTVCHKYHFVNPETGVHTQHVYSNRIRHVENKKKQRS